MYNLYIMKWVLNLIGSLEVVYFFNKIMPAKYEKNNIIYTLLIILFYSILPSMNMYIISNTPFNINLFNMVLIYHILVLIYPIFLRRGTFGEKFFLTSLYILIVALVSYGTHILASIIFSIDIIDIIEIFKSISNESIIVALVLKIVHIIAIVRLSRYMNFVKYLRTKVLYLIGIIFILNYILLVTAVRYMIESLASIDNYIIMMLVLFLFIQIVFLYVLKIFSKELEEKFQLEMNLKHRKHEQEIIDIYKEIRGWKHDFRNHINMILGLLETSNKEDAIEYIREMDYRTSEFEQYIYTENIAIDSILSSKVKLAKEKNIKVDISLDINSDIKISNIDMCTVLGNLMDNSIEACDKIDEGKFINLKIMASNDRLIIKIKNNTNGEINKLKGKFLTTKQEGMHGIGLIQIDSVINKYGGYISRNHDNNIFDTSIMIQYDN